MRRLAAVALSLLWGSMFAGLSAVCLFAADRGAEDAVAIFKLPASLGEAGTFMSAPVFAGYCFGAAVVAALFATVMVSSAINGQAHIRQGAFTADMAFGGALGLDLLALAGFALNGASALVAAASATLLALAVSFAMMRRAMRGEEPEKVSPLAVRHMAISAAAANSNVVAFPFHKAATGA